MKLYTGIIIIFLLSLNLLGVSPSSKFANIHTSIYSHHIPGSFTHLHPRWTDDRFAGATIMYNFASALLVAKRKFGVSNKKTNKNILYIRPRNYRFCLYTSAANKWNPTRACNHPSNTSNW